MQNTVPVFYDFDEYTWLIEAARKIDPRIYLLVLLGGDGGLRKKKVIALEQTDCDLRRGQITVRRSEWKGVVAETKGMEARVVPMTQRLWKALKSNEHLGTRVLASATMDQVTAKVVLRYMKRAQRRAKLKASGGFHVLRHTFCSHLAMRGAPAIAIQRLAGHKNLQTTLRYMHLAPGETERAIRLLEEEKPAQFGDILETGTNVVPIFKHHQ
ncbi:MAG: phage integrase family protein [Myxococcales bacterium]|nr:phage integrase family protein [Myxococcales bacterium]